MSFRPLQELASIKPWLFNNLEPICDADPNVLSDYILALLKHESSEGQLKLLCQSSLEDFLGDATSSFVARLFTFLSTPPSPVLRPAGLSTQPRGVKRALELDSRLNPSTSKIARVDTSHRIPDESLPTAPAAMRNLASISNVRATERPLVSCGPVRELCKDYHNMGFCARGNHCNFHHDDPTPPQQPYSQTTANPQSLGSLNSTNYSLPFPSVYAYMPSQDRSNSSSKLGPRPLLRQPPQSNTGRTITPLADRSIQSPNTLVVENVPLDALDNVVVRQFFSSFGPISHVAVDPAARKALVSFTSTDHAKKALSSPNAIFGNRFVRIYRQRLPTNAITSSPQSTQVIPIAPRTQAALPSSPQTRMDIDLDVIPAKVERAIYIRQQQLDLLAKQMQSNAQEQTTLLRKLDQSPPLSIQERNKTMSILRKLAVEIKLLSDSSKGLITLSAAPVSSEPALQLALLRSEAASLGIDTARKAPSPLALEGGSKFLRKTPSVTNRHLPTKPQAYRLDNRTRKLQISAVPEGANEKNLLRSYFERFGDITDLRLSSPNEWLLEYKIRSSAEQALSKGSLIPDVGLVRLEWAPSTLLSTASAEVYGAEFSKRENKQERLSVKEEDPERSFLDAESKEGAEEEETERSWNR